MLTNFVYKSCWLSWLVSVIKLNQTHKKVQFDYVRSPNQLNSSRTIGFDCFWFGFVLLIVYARTKAQTKIISKGDKKSDLHTVQQESAKNLKHQTPYGDQNRKESTGRKPCQLQLKSKGCFRCRNAHDRSASCPAKNSTCRHCIRWSTKLIVCA